MIIPIDNVGQFGIVRDRPYQEIPLNAWTAARNMRFQEGRALKMTGETEVYRVPVVPPHWLMPVQFRTDYLWLYAGATRVGATNGGSHRDISRAAGYRPNLDVGWTGGMIEGIPVITNGVDIPQMWKYPSLGTKLKDLEHWEITWRCNAMRTFKRYLVALGMTKSGNKYPHMIKWSHQAPTGDVPQTWNEADETIDAGEYTLPDDGGFIIDAFSLRDTMVVYKEYQTWLMQYVGGTEIFRFIKRFESIGCLSRHCAVEFFSGKHLIFTGDDIVQHDGQEAASVLTQKARSLIRGEVSTSANTRCFVAVNFEEYEVWVGFPEKGQTVCTKAIVWNWNQQTTTIRELDKVAFVETGIVDPSILTWENVPGTWDTIDTLYPEPPIWADREYDPSKRSLLLAFPEVIKLKQGDATNLFDADMMKSVLEKKYIGFPLKTGNPPDYTRMKQVIGIYPHISGTIGGIVNITLAPQFRVEDEPEFGAPKPFVIGSTDYIDTSDIEAARMHALRFESNSDISWSLDGYDVDVVDRGRYG